MSDGKRRDNKGRILLTGEYQHASGRYSYKYTNSMKQRKVVYSWRLTQADVTPPNRKHSKPLRDQEKEIQRFLLRGIYAEDMSVCDLVDRYLATKTGVRHNTEVNYYFVKNILKKEPFGAMKISRVKLSDAKLFLIKPQSDGKGYSTIHSVRGVLRPAFQMEVDDEMLLRNPFEFQLAVKKHNKIYRVQLPRISPHICRHTYCSNMAKSGMNPKTLQYLMGHSEIGVTLNTYTHLGEQDAKEEMVKLGLVSSKATAKRIM